MIDIDERHTELRLKCAAVAARFFPQLADGVHIAQVCDLVYEWVTKEDDE